MALKWVLCTNMTIQYFWHLPQKWFNTLLSFFLNFLSHGTVYKYDIFTAPIISFKIIQNEGSELCLKTMHCNDAISLKRTVFEASRETYFHLCVLVLSAISSAYFAACCAVCTCQK